MTAFSDKMTIGEKYDPAMSITDQAEADAYFERCVEHTMRVGLKDKKPLTREEAEDIERQNLGYYAGYCSNETREQVERLFRCKHPVFGSVKENGAPTAFDALVAGVKRGAGVRS